jgi:FAD/FMN-containing dehydrogenase
VVALPKTNQDIVTLVRFAEKHKISLIPRTAGNRQQKWETVVVDVSKYFTKIVVSIP